MSRFTSANTNVGLASAFSNVATTTPIQTKFIVTTDKSLPNDKGVTINLKKDDILQGVSRSSMGSMVTDGGGQGLTFTDKDGNKFSISVNYRGFQPFYKELDSTVVTDDQKAQSQSPAMSEAPLLSRLFTGGAFSKNVPLLLLAVVAGYFAYKKFKK